MAALGSFLSTASRGAAPVSGKVTVRRQVLNEIRRRGPCTFPELLREFPHVNPKQVDNAIRTLRHAGRVQVVGKVESPDSLHQVNLYEANGVDLPRLLAECGFDATHAKAHELADAAACLLLELTQGPGLAVDGELGPPTTWVSTLAVRLRGEPPLRVLQVAGALIAAEMDRLQRVGEGGVIGSSGGFPHAGERRRTISSGTTGCKC